MARIVVRKAGVVELERELGDGPVGIGRDAGNEVTLPDPSVSRRHARIERTPEGAYRITDLDSGNGVVHEGRRVPFFDLFPGCQVEIGSCSLTFEDDASPPLLVLVAGGPQQAYPLGSEETLVGRSPEAQISIPDPLVSSRHLKIVRRGELFAAVDLESENGTRVNGVRVSSRELQQGDQIQVGALTFFFAQDGKVPAPDSIRILQPVHSPSAPPAAPAEAAAPRSLPPKPAPAAKAAASSSSRPRLLLLATALFTVLFFIVLFLLVRSPDDAAEREFQEVFQADLTAEERDRIAQYLAQASQYETAGNLELALEQYQKVLVLDETHHQAQAESARLDEALRRDREARAERERLERETQARVASLAERAAALLSESKFQESREVLEEARALAPESEVLTAKLAETHVAEGNQLRNRNPQSARAAYERALSLDPDNAAARQAITGMDRNRQVLRERQTRVEELTERGLAQLKSEDFRAAYASFSEVLKLEPANARAKEFRDQASHLLEARVRPIYDEGVRLYEAGELTESMAQFQRVLAQNPDHADTRAFLARALQKVRSEAVDRYKRAYIYEGLGRLNEALALYRECLDLLPDPNEEYHQKASQRIQELSRRLP